MTNQTEEKNWSEEVGKLAYESIVEMIAALECDYDRLEELRDQEERTEEENEELAELEAAAGDCESRNDAEQRIMEDPLSLEIRSDWVSVGEEMKAGEFNLLLATGGPAVRIMGELDDYNEPRRARLEVQDWFKPWTQYFGADQDILLTYVRCFCFGS